MSVRPDGVYETFRRLFDDIFTLGTCVECNYIATFFFLGSSPVRRITLLGELTAAMMTSPMSSSCPFSLHFVFLIASFVPGPFSDTRQTYIHGSYNAMNRK